jgi:hypothetical protein
VIFPDSFYGSRIRVLERQFGGDYSFPFYFVRNADTKADCDCHLVSVGCADLLSASGLWDGIQQKSFLTSGMFFLWYTAITVVDGGAPH